MSFQPHFWRRYVEPGLVAETTEPENPAPALIPLGPDGRGLQLRRSVQESRSRGCEEGSAGGDDRLAVLVAGGLRSLRTVFYSYGMAQRRHVSHWRRPRRCRFRPAALRTAQ